MNYLSYFMTMIIWKAQKLCQFTKDIVIRKIELGASNSYDLSSGSSSGNCYFDVIEKRSFTQNEMAGPLNHKKPIGTRFCIQPILNAKVPLKELAAII